MGCCWKHLLYLRSVYKCLFKILSKLHIWSLVLPKFNFGLPNFNGNKCQPHSFHIFVIKPSTNFVDIHLLAWQNIFAYVVSNLMMRDPFLLPLLTWRIRDGWILGYWTCSHLRTINRAAWEQTLFCLSRLHILSLFRIFVFLFCLHSPKICFWVFLIFMGGS